VVDAVVLLANLLALFVLAVVAMVVLWLVIVVTAEILGALWDALRPHGK
jgi:cell shape-determining protein MreD